VAEKKNSKGFTLVEIAIVLVIIGLLVGATVTGQQLISGAQANRAVAQMRDVTAAYLCYFDRYKAMPGDDPQASSRWPEAKNGNGDGLISGRFDAVPPTDPTTLVVNSSEGENLNFWWHLRLAGLITGSSDDTSPASPITHPFGGRAGIQQNAFGMRSAALCMANVPASMAGAVDARADDQHPDRGSTRGAPEAGGAPPAVYPTTDDAYVLCGSVAGSSSGPAVALNSTDGSGGTPGAGGSAGGGTAGGGTAGGGTAGGGTGGSGWGGPGWGGGGPGWGGGGPGGGGHGGGGH
jgi:prepilin-type N-terminal cleavage/methylation domain-containing protein